MNEIKLKSGKTFLTDFFSVIHNPERMYINISGSSLQEIAEYFGDEHETSEILFDGKTYTGYTFLAIIKEGNSYRVDLGR